MKNCAIISADIISSTALSVDNLKEMQKCIRDYIDQIEALNGDDIRYWGRIVKGDSIEIYVRDPKDVLRVALQLKTLVMQHNTNGLRVAIGIGEMREVNRELDMMDGDAIYRAGRLLSQMSSHSKGGKKGNFAADCSDSLLSQQLDAILKLFDVILRKTTYRQCKIMFYKLMNVKDIDIAKNLEMSTSAVSQHKTSMGWDAIENMLNYFEQTL